MINLSLAKLRDLVDPPICYLHIGKTGGSYVKSVLEPNIDRADRRIVLMKHRHTVAMTRQIHGPRRQLAFVFREPTERFVSGFYSRKRMGRPTYDVPWTQGEARAFAQFGDAAELADALGSSDAKLRNAALDAMQEIKHLRLNYAYTFGSVEAFEKETPRIVACLDTKNLDAGLSTFLARLGISDPVMPARTVRHANPDTPPPLSRSGVDALQRFWAEEYRLYDCFRRLEERVIGG